MPTAEVHDVLNDADMSNQFTLNTYNTLRILVNNYDASVPADVELNSEGEYSWSPAGFEKKPIQTDRAGQQYVLVTSQPSKAGSPAAGNVVLHVTVVTGIDAAQNDFPVAYLAPAEKKASAAARS